MLFLLLTAGPLAPGARRCLPSRPPGGGLAGRGLLRASTCACSSMNSAISLAPDQLTLRGTQGSLLVEQGDYGAAWPILLDVFYTDGF